MFGWRRKFRPTPNQQVITGADLVVGDFVYDFGAPGKGVCEGDDADVISIHTYDLDGRPMLSVTGGWPEDPSGEQWSWTIDPDEPVLIRKR